ncbi:MAG: dihydroorotate dehydrogenase, partial [Parasphingorhabdus sp.]
SGGLSQFVGNFRRFNTDCISGINLGKNANTPNEDAISDYKAGMHQCYALADYLTINISSPNTKGLRNLQQGDDLQHLLKSMHETRCELEDKHQKRVPLALKIAPDLEPDAIKMIADTCQNHAMDAIIAANTTIQRPESLTSVIAKETGGLSGAPLSEMSTRIINLLRQALGESFPIIGVGGIMSAADAMEKFSAGANLVQIYTGFVYQGPKLIHEIVSRYENASRTG